MKTPEGKPDKDLYRRLRTMPWKQLWTQEAAHFNHASPLDRTKQVAVIRAVGVVFSESGPVGQKEEVRQWLLGLLHDPHEKARRYAMAALPKIGANPSDEAKLISVLRASTSDRERKFLGQTLEKIGGAATLEIMDKAGVGLPQQSRQKVEARLARDQSPSAVRLQTVLSDFSGVQIRLRGRIGSEAIMRDEVEAAAQHDKKFHVAGSGSGFVSINPVAPFSLADIYKLRCFGTAGFLLGTVPPAEDSAAINHLASVIASEMSLKILRTFTEGAVRYRLNFVSQGHQRAAVRQLAERVHALRPELLNDGRQVTWTVDIGPVENGTSVELRPNLTPDPRFYYRKDDIPAASHPSLAACLARFAGRVKHEIVWDPFCGSGMELIESALLGGVDRMYGTDHNPTAISIARANFAAANVKNTLMKFASCDFRDFSHCEGLGPESVTLIITNPPLGKRVFTGNLQNLIEDLFNVAGKVLKPGGRLVFINPLRMQSPTSSIKLQSSQPIELAGFDCRLEKYEKSAP